MWKINWKINALLGGGWGWGGSWDFVKGVDTSISVVSNNADNTLSWANQKENIDELDVKAIANAETNRVSTNNQFTLGALLNNWFFEAHEFEIVVDGWVVYAEVWSSANAYAWGTTYNRWNQTIYNNVRYFSLVDSNTWNQPDTSPTEWEWITQADFNLHWFIEWSNRIFNLDTTSWSWVDWHARIALTAWTDAQGWEVRNYVWAEMNGTLDLHLAIGTTEPTWPVIVLGFADIPTVATTITQWPNNQQRYTNWLYKESIFKGQQEMLRDKARHRVTYESWVVPSMTITPNWGAIDSAIFNSTLWITHQLWEQIFPAFSWTPVFYVLNHPTNPPTQQYTDLNELDVDANWVTLRDNNDRYAFRVWGNQSSGTNSVDAIWLTLPEGKYSTDNNALIDNQNFDITAIPSNKVNTFFNIWRVVLKYTTVNSWTFENLVWWTDVQNKRGEIIWAEWGTWWAVGSQTEFTDAEFLLRNATDPTKEVDFDLSWISGANKRTATMPDKDITLADDADIPDVAIWTELDTWTDDVKYASSKAIKDSKNVPSVVPWTSWNVLESDWTNWISATPTWWGWLTWGDSISSWSWVSVTMTSSDLDWANAFQSSIHTASWALSNNSTTQNTFETHRTCTAGSATDNFIWTLFKQTSVANGWNLNSYGSIVKIQSVDTQTSWTLNTGYHMLAMVPSVRCVWPAISISWPSNMLSRSNWLVWITVSSTQTNPILVQKTDLWTSAQWHTWLLISARWASTSQRWVHIDLWTTWHWTAFEISGSDVAGWAKVFEIDTNLTQAWWTATWTTTKEIKITVSWTDYIIETKSEA